MKLLLVEDEQAMAEAIEAILTFHHYTVDAVACGEDALSGAAGGHYDGIILDIMLPGMDGFAVLKKLRAMGVGSPVLLLSARGEVADRIRGLNLGADDYLPKPFAMGELVARVRAMLRRREPYTPDVLRLGNIALDRDTCVLKGQGGSCPLSRLEFQLMEFFLLNQGLYFSSEKLLERVWGLDSDADVGTVWVYISYLRKKLSQLEAGVVIRCKRGVGYALEVKA